MYKMESIVASSVCGYHVYNNWIGALGEELYYERDIGKVIDRYTLLL